MLNVIFFSSFGASFLALVLVYDYHPGSQTLLAKYFTPTSESNNYQDPFQGEARPFRLVSTDMDWIMENSWKQNSFTFLAIKVICSEHQMDHIYLKPKFGQLSCNWQPACVQYIKPVLLAGNYSIMIIIFIFWSAPEQFLMNLRFRSPFRDTGPLIQPR